MKSDRLPRMTGFTLLPVILAMSLIAAIGFLLNRDNGMNAEMAAGENDLARARYAAEAGLQAVNYKVQSIGCSGTYPVAGSSPVTESNFGGASFVAYGNSVSAPPTTLYATGTYNGASVTLTRNAVVSYQPGTKTYSLQPNASAGKDTYVDASKPGHSYGDDQDLRLSTAQYEILLRFDLSVFPAGSRTVPWFDTVAGNLRPGAELALYQSNSPAGSGVTVDALPIIRTWAEGTTKSTADGASWNTYDGSNAWPAPGVGYDTAAVTSTPYSASNGWKTWDVSGMANMWLNGLYANNGLWLRPSGGALSGAKFTSSDDAGHAAQWPKIAFNYLLPCGATAPGSLTTVTLGATQDGQVNAGTSTLNYGGANSMGVRSGGGTLNALARFDLSSIPAGKLLISAKLRLFVSSLSNPTTNAKAISAFKLTRSWIEGNKNGAGTADGATWLTYDAAANWTTPGGDYAASAVATATEESSGIAPPPAGFSGGWLTWDITGLAQEWIDGMSPNYGIILLSTVSDWIVVDTREQGGATAPQLVIAY